MKTRFCLILFICGLCVLTGCPPQQQRPIWKDIKITDLGPATGPNEPAITTLKTMNFDVYVFEILPRQVSAVNEAASMLYTQPLRFNNKPVFEANGFFVGYGPVDIWDKIGDTLRTGGAVTTEKTSVLLTDGDWEDAPAVTLEKKITLYFRDGTEQTRSAEVGPGFIALRLKAEKIPGQRGVCRLLVQPVFTAAGSSPRTGKPWPFARDFVFSAVRFDLNMTGGDFIFIAPESYTTDLVTLNSIFFWNPGPRPAVRTYLIICTAIID